jgi:phenylacetate-CoA ligase
LQKDLCKIFGSEIFSFYGSEEFGPLAFECKEHQGYHIISDHVVMEFLKENKDVSTDERGEVVVTGLTNYEMPLIRYRIGDIATPSSGRCHCGRRFPMIKQIEGREDDFVTLPSGKKISPRMINVIENIPGIKEYQTIQVSKERFVVELVKDNRFSERTISDIKTQIMKGCLGEKVKVEVELVDKIHRERTGKRRAVISKVK